MIRTLIVLMISARLIPKQHSNDNAIPYCSFDKRVFQCYNWETLSDPFDSLDLTLSDYHLFGPRKCHFGGQKFDTNKA